MLMRMPQVGTSELKMNISRCNSSQQREFERYGEIFDLKKNLPKIPGEIWRETVSIGDMGNKSGFFLTGAWINFNLFKTRHGVTIKRSTKRLKAYMKFV